MKTDLEGAEIPIEGLSTEDGVRRQEALDD